MNCIHTNSDFLIMQHRHLEVIHLPVELVVMQEYEAETLFIRMCNGKNFYAIRAFGLMLILL